MTNRSRDRNEPPMPGPDPLSDLEESADLAEVPPRSMTEAWDAAEWSLERTFDGLTDVLSSISGNLEFSSLTDEILSIALSTVGASRGVLFLGETPSTLSPARAVNIESDSLADLDRISQTLLAQVLSGPPILTADAQTDVRLRDIPSVRLHQIRAVLCVPLVKRGRPSGLIYLDHNAPLPALPRHTRRFMSAFASVAAVALDNARLHGELLLENARLIRRTTARETFGRIVTTDPGMIELLERAAMVAQVDFSALILGESGTGKELLAHAIHEASNRALQPFVAYNCAAVPSELMESLFFGQVRGAFTGAVRDTPGLFRQADGGVLFLDEIGELNGELQAKLLRALQDGVVRPLGSDREYTANVRILAATSRDLTDLVRSGRFREDLYYRLNVLELRVPPLRERPGDIAPLVGHFLTRGSLQRPDRAAPLRFSKEALDRLEALSWRGNVRELESFVYRACVFCPGPVVDVDDLSALQGSLEAGTSADRPSQPPLPPTVPTASLADVERSAIVDALRKAGGNKSKAARFLGLHRNSLLRRMERLDIHWQD